MKKLMSKIPAKLSSKAPAICVGVGIVGVIAGVVIACKDTQKEVFTIEKDKATLSFDIKEAESPKQKIVAYGRFAKAMFNIYWPSAAVIGGSLGVMVCGHKILNNRYVKVVGAYEVLDKSYREYRKRVKNEIGKPADLCFKHGLVLEDEYKTGDERVYVAGDTDIFIPDRDLSDFSIFWGPGYSILCTDNAADNFMLVRDIERQANDMFNRKGYLYLNDVYKMLGSDKVDDLGIGWVKGRGDDYVDFGIFSVRNGRAIDQTELVYLLDFNHDGCILPYI